MKENKMKITKLIPILTVIFMLVGCATTVKTSEQVKEKTQVDYDPYAKVFTITGMKMSSLNLGTITYYRLRGGFEKTGANEFFQLYVYHWSQSDWKFLHSASDVSGQAFYLRQLDRQVDSSANVIEEVAVDLPRGYLERHLSSGLNMRILGQRGSIIVTLPPDYIKGFLEKYGNAKLEYVR